MTEHDQPTSTDDAETEVSGPTDAEPEGIAQARPDDDGQAPAVVAAGPRVVPPRRTGVFLDPEDLRRHVGELLRATLGGYEVDKGGNFTFTHQGARVFVTVGASPMGPQVGVFSITNIGVELTPDLAAFLITTNHQLAFGAFSYDVQNKAVWLRHTLLGTMLDGPELQATVVSVAGAAAHFVEQVRERFGGRRFEDAPQEEQQRTRPPEASADPTSNPQLDGNGNASGYL